MTVTTTERPLLRLVTRTLLPNGNERCAAVNAPGSTLWPLAVLDPLSVDRRNAALAVRKCADDVARGQLTGGSKQKDQLELQYALPYVGTAEAAVDGSTQ
jgi:hypothetical protein